MLCNPLFFRSFDTVQAGTGCTVCKSQIVKALLLRSDNSGDQCAQILGEFSSLVGSFVQLVGYMSILLRETIELRKGEYFAFEQAGTLFHQQQFF